MINFDWDGNFLNVIFKLYLVKNTTKVAITFKFVIMFSSNGYTLMCFYLFPQIKHFIMKYFGGLEFLKRHMFEHTHTLFHSHC